MRPRLSRAQQAAIQREVNRLLLRRETLLQRGLQRELRRVFNEIADRLTSAGVLVPGSNVAEINKLIEKSLGTHSKNVSVILASSTTAALQSSYVSLVERLASSGRIRLSQAASSADASARFAKRAAAWERARVAKISPQISELTGERVSRMVSRTLAAGHTQDEIVSQLREMGESAGRARRIARTEMHTATMEAEVMSMEAASAATGLKLVKTWISVQDGRTRETHADANGQTVAMDAVFSIGETELSHPGDPNGPPEEIINCRCVLGWDEA